WARSLPALSPCRAVKGVDEPPRFLSLPQRLVDRGPGKARSLGEPSRTVRAWAWKHLIHAQPDPKELRRRRQVPREQQRQRHSDRAGFWLQRASCHPRHHLARSFCKRQRFSET